jgi:PAS domain S-box-containing protein
MSGRCSTITLIRTWLLNLGWLLAAFQTALAADNPAQNPPGITNAATVPLESIAAVKLRANTSASNALVRVRGTVLDERPGEFIVVHDESGTIFAETYQVILPAIKERADLLGRPAADGTTVSLKNTTVAPVAASESPGSGNSATPDRPTKLPTLTSAAEIRNLSAENAAWRYPVRLRAVVTVNPKINPYFFAQDDSAGISVRLEHVSTKLSPGDLVRIEGVTDPGGYSPQVLCTNVTVLGRTNLPAAQPETLLQLANGQDDSQWIELRGVVRSLSFANGLGKLNVTDSGGTISVNVPAEKEPTYLLDAIVRIQGACGSTANSRGQLAVLTMWASSLSDVSVEEAGVTDPLSQPTQSIASLGQFHTRQTLQHRINVAGVVTYAEADFFFIQDAEAGVRVQAPTGGRLQPGDYVMAAGYPGRGDFGFLLRDAVFKTVSHRPMPAPLILPVEQPLNPQAHDLWVQVKARFLRSSKIGTSDVLTLQMGNRVFDARTLTPISARIKNLEPGSVLQVSGIYRVLVDEARVPKSFQLAVPAERDLQILEEPSWWTTSRMIGVLGLMGGIIGATILWVFLLRRKVQEQTASLRESEQKFRALVEKSLVGVYVIQNEQFVYVNPRLAEIFGYTPAELTQPGHTVATIIAPEDLLMVREQIRRRIDKQAVSAHYFFRGRHKNGGIIQAEVLGSQAEYGGQPAVLGMLLDVTESKRAQDKLATQARMLDLACDAIVVCDFDDRITYWNQSATRIYGPSAEQAFGHSATAMMPVNSEAFRNAKTAVLKAGKWHGEFVHCNPAGEQVTVESRWTLVRDAEGSPKSILAISTDITQQKKLEARFLRTQRMESIGILAGGIAHDLNNVLAPILMSCHLLEIEQDIVERKQLVENILGSTHRAADLVKQILTFARGSDGRRALMQPRFLLTELQKILTQTLPKTIQLKIEIAPDLWVIYADSTQLHQVLMNLCLNARDAMPAGGQLTVTAENVMLVDDASARRHEVPLGTYVLFTVTDTGTGIPPEIRDRIFDPFFTTKDVGKGTGLGLSTSLGIVKSHDGALNVQSIVSHGASFKAYLPAQPAARLPEATEDDSDRTMHGNNELVLVVDDEPAIRDGVQKTLELFGYRVCTANDGAQAVACYARQKSEIALVLMDMTMPVMDGPAAIHALARMNSEINIIAASGLANAGAIANINSPTVRAFLPKPYTADNLLRTIREVLHSRSANS